jgi:hypothetical protein
VSIKKKPSLAYRSPLWEHRDRIRRWRLERLTWREISEKLKKEHGVDLTLQAVRIFFKKASERDKQGKPPQLGFFPDVPIPSDPPTPPTHVTPAPDVDAKKEEPEGDVHDQALDAIALKKQEPQPERKKILKPTNL